MSVTKRYRRSGSGKTAFYHAEVYVRGVRVDYQDFDTAAAAHLWHDKTKERCKESDFLTDEESNMPFSDCAEKYLEFAKSRVRFATLQKYQVRLVNLKASPFYRIKVRDISARVVDRWLERLIQQPTATSRGRKNFLMELEVLSVILQWYRNYQNANYVVPITKRHRERANFRSVKKRRADYFIRPEEVRPWIDWLQEHRRPVYSRLATFMMLTGTRVGEASAMMWDAVDFENRLIHVKRTVSWDRHSKLPTLVDETKTEESNRIVKIPEELVLSLKEWKLQSGGDPLVFPSWKAKGVPLKYNAVQSAFNGGFIALGLPWRSTHICRHTYATIAYLATGNLTSVQASLGHKRQVMTERYAKAVAHLSSETAEKTAAVFALKNKSR